jgi:putative zinc finger/helix-turn-helix YgiT family protein
MRRVMDNGSFGTGKDETRGCLKCRAQSVREIEKELSFDYGTEHPVLLTVAVPTWTCEACGFSYTDGRAEQVQHVAVCRHLNVWTPAEIIEFRKRHRLSRTELAQLTGFGVSSIQRWERGAQIQNASADRFLRLLDDQDVLQKLRRLEMTLAMEKSGLAI